MFINSPMIQAVPTQTQIQFQVSVMVVSAKPFSN